MTQRFSPETSIRQSSAFLQLLTHNMTGGKGVRGLTVVMAYEMLEKPDKLTEESMKLARTLGWCYEMVSFDLGKVRVR